MLNTRVHDLLRVSLRLSDRLLSEGNVESFIGLLHNTLLNPVVVKNPGDLHQFLHCLRNWNVSDALRGPLLGSVFGYGLRQFHQLLDHLRHKDIRNLFHCTMQVSVLA